MLKHKLHALKTNELPEDGQKLKPKRVVALINKYIVLTFAWSLSSSKL